MLFLTLSAKRKEPRRQMFTVLVIIAQLLSHVWLFATPRTAARQASLSFTISWSVLKLMSFKLEMPPNHFILCHPLLLLPSVFPSESALRIRWPKYWSFSFSISPSLNIQGWFPLGLTGSILQAKGLSRVFSSTIVWKHQFFGSQPSLWSMVSHPYLTTGKNIALHIRTFVSKMTSLLFNMLSRFVIEASIFLFHGCSHHPQWFWRQA